LTVLLGGPDTETSMARYSAFLGRKVEVQYRAGDILLPASGTFVADSGRSIFLEQNFELRGNKLFRWEIPYQYIVKIEEMPDTEMKPTAGGGGMQKSETQEEVEPEPAQKSEPLSAKSAAAGAAGGGCGLLPMANRPHRA
jgi:hypothetical protein